MLHGIKIVTATQGHVQGIVWHADFRLDDSGSRDGTVGFCENGRQIIVLDQSDNGNQLGGGGFTAGFFFNGCQNFQIVSISQIGKTIMEGDELTTAKICQSLCPVIV